MNWRKANEFFMEMPIVQFLSFFLILPIYFLLCLILPERVLDKWFPPGDFDI